MSFYFKVIVTVPSPPAIYNAQTIKRQVNLLEFGSNAHVPFFSNRRLLTPCLCFPPFWQFGVTPVTSLNQILYTFYINVNEKLLKHHKNLEQNPVIIDYLTIHKDDFYNLLL
jgi:hypothetical protein